ncbi:DUF2970 domain-containing protein [Agaribacter flavus]|uniref:DUF2970 domain-containing protein n=1 Tax=Agaribacter flavus TaxID=1902781 RepID=A0ABV7FTG2_9ALTE
MSNKKYKPSFLRQLPSIVWSVLASFFGVQSEKNYRKDFSQFDSILPFVLVGLFMLIAFVLFVIALVNLAT